MQLFYLNITASKSFKCYPLLPSLVAALCNFVVQVDSDWVIRLYYITHSYNYHHSDETGSSFMEKNVLWIYF